MGDWTPTLRAGDLPIGRIKAATLGDAKIILLRVQGEVVAYEDRCPHEEHPLSLGDLEDGVLTCSKHLWEFDARTGLNLNDGVRAGHNLVRFPVRIVDGVVEVDVATPIAIEGSSS